MEAAWTMLQQDEADDYVIGTGEAHSVQDFVDAAFSSVGLDSADYVETSQEFFRPTKTSTLIADTTKAKEAFGFECKNRFNELVKLMVEADIERER
jgi:GDPmannose 4,6-dehydratase